MAPPTLRDLRSAGITLAIVSAFPFLMAGMFVTLADLGAAALSGTAGALCVVAAWNCIQRRVTLSADAVHIESPVGGPRQLSLEQLSTLHLQEHRILMRRTGGVILVLRDRSRNELGIHLRDKAAFAAIAPWVKAACERLAAAWEIQLDAGQNVAVSQRVSLGTKQLEIGGRALPLAPAFELKEYSTWLSAVLEVRSGEDLLSIHGDEENYLPLREALRTLHRKRHTQLAAQA